VLTSILALKVMSKSNFTEIYVITSISKGQVREQSLRKHHNTYSYHVTELLGLTPRKEI